MKSSMRGNKEKIIKNGVTAVRTINECIEEERIALYGDSFFYNLIDPGGINLFFGKRSLEKTIFGYWLGLLLAEKVHSVFHYSWYRKKYLSYFQNYPSPSNFFKGFIRKESEDIQMVLDSIRVDIEKVKGNTILILDNLKGVKWPGFRETEAVLTLEFFNELSKEFKRRGKALTIIILSDIKRIKPWISPSLEHVFNGVDLKKYFDRISCFSESATNPALNYIKLLKSDTPSHREKEILLLEQHFPFGNYHYRIKAWGREVNHLAKNPTELRKAALTAIGSFALNTIRKKYWEGISENTSYSNELAIKYTCERFILDILELAYKYAKVIPLSHIEYIISSTRISVSFFDDVAKAYFSRNGLKYEIKDNCRNIEPLESREVKYD